MGDRIKPESGIGMGQNMQQDYGDDIVRMHREIDEELDADCDRSENESDPDEEVSFWAGD